MSNICESDQQEPAHVEVQQPTLGLQDNYIICENNINISGNWTAQMGHGKSEIKDILAVITVKKQSISSETLPLYDF